MIKVEVVDYMGSDLSTVNSARVSFNKESLELSESDTKLINYLATHRHLTPFRHNQIQLRCSAPIFLVRQLGKHQAGLSWNEVSRRYVDSTPTFFTPPEWRMRPEGSIKQGSTGSLYGKEKKIADAHYKAHLKHSLDLYREMLEDGIAPELARIVLPQSMITEWFWSGNLLAFAHVYKERSADSAQEEAQEFAAKLDAVIKPLFPESWACLTH